MRYIIYALVTAFLLSCNQSEIKQKELALKEKELALRERELALKEKDSVNLNKVSSPTITNGKLSQNEISNWLKDACGISYTFSSNELDKAKFSTLNNYLTLPTEELKKLLQEPLLVELINKGITAKTIQISPYSISF